MDVGLFVNAQASEDESPEALVEGIARQVRTARDSGFDFVLSGQHYLTDNIQLQPIPILSYLSSLCGSMTLGTGVLLLPLHHPVDIAEQISTLDALVDETIVGVGAGYRTREFEAFDVDQSKRGSRLQEGIELLDRLWTRSNVTYDGEHYSVEHATINPKPEEKPTVWVGANTAKTVRRAACFGDSWFASPSARRSHLLELKKAYDDERQQSGKDSTIAVLREAFVAPAAEDAVSVVRPHLEAKYARYAEWRDAKSPASFSDLATERFLIGDPEKLAESIRRYDRDLEVEHLALRVHWPGMSHDHSVKCIQLIGDEILPTL